MVLFKEDILLLADLADVNCFVSTIDNIIEDRFLSLMISLLRLPPKNMRLSFVFPQLIVDIMASSLMDLVHILVKHSQNGPKHLSGIVLAIPKEEWIVL